jgi:hypothetical protein
VFDTRLFYSVIRMDSQGEPFPWRSVCVFVGGGG